MRNAVIGASLVILLAGTPSLVSAADRLDELEGALEAQKKTIVGLNLKFNT